MGVQVQRDGAKIAVVAGAVARISPEQAMNLAAQLIDAVDELVSQVTVPVEAELGGDPLRAEIPAGPDATTPGAVVVKLEPLQLTLTPLDALQLAKDAARIADVMLTELETV